MKIYDHTIYAPTKIDRHDKTSALSVPSVVDTYQYGYVANSNLIGSVTFPNGLVTTKTYETNRNLIDKVENKFGTTVVSKYDFTNDAIGRRSDVAKSGTAFGTADKVTFTYDGWNLIQEVEASVYDSNNSVFTQFRTSNYTWGLDLSQTIQGAGGVSGLLSLDKGTATYYYTYDANGNVSELIDSVGVVKAHYEYSPFGKVVHKSGPLADKTPFQFSSKYLDNETQLYYYGYRYYNPETGRWINRDPINEKGGYNIYGFVSNSSTWHVDRLGLDLFYWPWESVPPSTIVPGNIVTIITDYTTDEDRDDWEDLIPDNHVDPDDAENIGDVIDTLDEKGGKNCITTLNLSGHGAPGTGVSFDNGSFNGSLSDADAEKTRKRLCKNAVINICSCGDSDRDADRQALANKLMRKVCSCKGTTNRGCKCDGEWKCAHPAKIDPNAPIYKPSGGEKKK